MWRIIIISTPIIISKSRKNCLKKKNNRIYQSIDHLQRLNHWHVKKKKNEHVAPFLSDPAFSNSSLKSQTCAPSVQEEARRNLVRALPSFSEKRILKKKVLPMITCTKRRARERERERERRGRKRNPAVREIASLSIIRLEVRKERVENRENRETRA